MKTAVFLFHRDLRLADNTTLIYALENNYKIIPMFIFPPEQIDPKKNSYFSHPAVQFMCESLQDLNEQLKEFQSELYFAKGKNSAMLEQLYKKIKFEAVFSNEDYSKYARERDLEISNWCKKKNIIIEQKEYY